jgi:hypothetical protein
MNSVDQYLEFNEFGLKKYVISSELGNDTLYFDYESGTLSVIRFEDNAYSVTVDSNGNIVSVSNNAETQLMTYDGGLNPLKGLLMYEFISQFPEDYGVENRVDLRSICRFFSVNNLVNRNSSIVASKYYYVLGSYPYRVNYFFFNTDHVLFYYEEY